jgi:uncharacterized membrane protein
MPILFRPDLLRSGIRKCSRLANLVANDGPVGYFSRINMQAIEEALQRWIGAGVLDESTAERIRLFEASRERPSGLRWQVLLALIFGAILLAAGVTLFVAAHWDELSPAMRFIVVLAMLSVLHVGGLLARPHFEWLAVTLHGVGTVAAGAAVALVGQIFNIQEHWPAGVLLWALCALAGWALLRDQVQQTISMLLAPAWIVCEWSARTDGYQGSQLFMMRMVVVFAAVYLTAFLQSKKQVVFDLLFGTASVTLIVGTAFLTDFYAGFALPCCRCWPHGGSTSRPSCRLQ